MNFLAIGALALIAALTGAAGAQQPVPRLTGAVVDQTGTLDANALRELDTRLREFAAQRGSQVAVLLVPSTKPESIEQYSIRVAEGWKIGRAKIDDGVIVVVAKDDRALRIEVGYGLEGAIPDVVAKRVISEYIAPRFRAGDFAGGLRDGTNVLMKLIEGEKLPTPEFAPSASQKDFTDLIVPLFIAVAVGATLAALMGRFLGAGIGALGFGVAAWSILGVLWMALAGAILAFVLVLANGISGGGRRRGGWASGGWGDSGGGWGGGSGGGFSGGGGGFGGGGASGNW